MHHANIHAIHEENGVIITEDITSDGDICTFDLYWLTSDDGVHYIRESERYKEVTLPVAELEATLTTNGLAVLSMIPMSKDERNILNLDDITEGLYVIAQKRA